MSNLADVLKKNRSNLSASSIRTYVSILKNLYDKMDGTGDIHSFFAHNIPQVLDFLKNDKPNLRKTKLAVLVSLLGDIEGIDKLKSVMLNDANAYNASLRQQQMSKKQAENWMTQDEVQRVYQRLHKEAQATLKKERITKKDYNLLLDYVLLSLYVLIPPRRSQDFTEMKIRNIKDKDKENYFDGKNFVFQQYKTAKVYGSQTLPVPLKLKKILQRWMTINPYDYLLSSAQGKKMSVSRMTILLNKIFDKNVSTTLLRHIYLSTKLKDAPLLNERDELAKDMGHSVAQQELYRLIKKPPTNK